MMIMRALFVAVMTLSVASVWGPALAQSNLFAPVIQVNDRVITQYELDQRIRFFQLLRAPGDLEQQARDRLVEERLQMEAAAAMGVTVSDEQLLTGMEEFAGRANLSVEDFIKALEQNGVAAETLQDFVRAGVAWRGVVRTRFGPRAQITEAEIDRALALSSNQGAGGVRVLLSEIFLPADTPARQAEANRRATEISRITTIPAFAAAARRYSAAPTRARGGRQDWIDLGNLPPAIRGQILTLAPGQVTAPIPVPNAIALFQLRALEETGAPEAEALSVDFARYFIPGGRTESALAQAAKLRAEVDTCDDLYGVAQGQPDERLLRDVLPISDIQGDIAIELAKLDTNEVSTGLTTGDGQALVFLMLCGRTLQVNEDVNREAVRENLINQRMVSYASGYLSELKSDAIIQYK